MAYFDCIVGGSGKGNTLVVTCADDLAGATITCTNGTKTYTKTCPSTSPYEVTFYGLMAGTWAVSATVSGDTYTTTVVITDYEAELGGFSWRAWVDLSKNYTSSDFTDLDDLLSDETAIRELMTIHACVDYLAGIATESADVETIIGNDLCAKWINNRDYALDTLYANEIIAGYMDTADKYFYGEWCLMPQVPTMTSNTAPYGEVSASSSYSPCPPWHAFDGSDQISGDNYVWASGAGVGVATLTYKSISPIRVATFMIQNGIYIQKSVKDFIFQGSNDGSTWENLLSDSNPSTAGQKNYYTIPDANRNYYLYHRISVSNTHGSENILIANAQFYAWAPKGNVPVMTSNNAPYGTAFQSAADSGYEAYKAFDGNNSTYFASDGTSINQHVGYTFTNPIKAKKAYIDTTTNLGRASTYSFIIQASNDGTNWSNVSEEINTGASTSQKHNQMEIELNTNNKYFSQYRAFRTKRSEANLRFCFYTIQIYGRELWKQENSQYVPDYSEKEFETGTTKKWLYDHGVELEALTGNLAWSGGTFTKRPSSFLVQNDKGAGAQADLTDYSLAFLRIGKECYNYTSTNLVFIICANASDSSGSLGLLRLPQSGMPRVSALDVSSDNQTAYVAAYAGANSKFECEEMWLE